MAQPDTITLPEDWPEVQKTLESRTTMVFEQINRRNWDPSLPPWKFADTKHFSFRRLGDGETLKGIDAMIESWKDFIDKYPDFYLKVIDVSSACTHNDDKIGTFAEVYVQLNRDGEEESIIRAIVCRAVWQYSKEAEDWKAAYAETLVGMDVAG